MDFAERVIPGLTSNFMYRQAMARYMFAKRYIRKPNLDIGCGTGYGTVGTGIDIDSEAIVFAKKHHKAEFIIGSALNLPFKNKIFSSVTSFEIIEHIKDYKKYLSEIKRVLKPNGILILSTPRKNGPSNSPYHVKEFTQQELNFILKKYFKSVKIYCQDSSKRAQKAWKDFLVSQEVRQNIIGFDFVNLRKLFPKELKEFMWKYLGNWFSKRKTQEQLTEKDFPIFEYNHSCQTLVAVCYR